MKGKPAHGFTLIELLTVIAIIGILAGMIFTLAPRFIEKAKLARAQNTLNQLRNSMTLYFTKNRESFPPRYGYLRRQPVDSNGDGAISDDERFFLIPYTAYRDIGAFRKEDLYDEFSDSHDTNPLSYTTNQPLINILEYSPLGTKVGPDNYVFNETTRYAIPAPPTGERAEEMRPYVYIPVNKIQAKRVAQYYFNIYSNTGNSAQDRLDALNARVWDSAAVGLNFPPPRYDAFVLIGVGPSGDTWGVLPDRPAQGEPDASHEDSYHIRALRAFFLATRDANQNMKADFAFSNRTTGGREDADPGTYVQHGLPEEACLMPVQARAADGTLNPGPGPIIYSYGYTE